jgi:hypothetical protein
MAGQANRTTVPVLTCPSCGRSTGQAGEVETVAYIGILWCTRCARVRNVGGNVCVEQPSPGRMIESPNIDVLDSWVDCFQMLPKRRIRIKVAKVEVQRAWEIWVGDKHAPLAKMMFFTWLQRHRPFFLTFRTKGDPWQDVHSWLLEYERANAHS